MFTGIGQEMARLRKEITKFEGEAVEDLKETTHYLVEQMFLRTPVYEGTTVRNYNVAVGRFSNAFSSAVGTGSPGPTNMLPLGAEPRRAANESAARAAMNAALSFKKLVNVYINNTAPHADLVEFGDAPGGPNQRIRNPGGVTALALQSTRGARKNWR